MVKLSDLPLLEGQSLQAYRLVNSKFPPIALFDDVADEDDFEALYQIQAITNPRLQNELGSLELISRNQIPFGIPGCSYATAPFTHVNPAGSRFSNGAFGVLYLADRLDTAIAEVRHHQERYWSNVAGLNYERFVFRGLTVNFSEAGMRDATVLPLSDAIYSPDDYSQSNALGAAAKQTGDAGLRYRSVRSPGNVCWALLTPRRVTSIIQAAHFEMIWSGQMVSVSQIKMLPDR
ncbi:RES family NAD+ phosphorylase [Pseudomonas seleniipraecipitans]|uniref:RES family NAD+ phosphorylase n=1 Tax=Phytopseudomonas seleniipraecipitans TaxID=640205 RepID=A0ABY5J993_9GAMM|nr:RES family NAD+ phosphorylase [Pseudomonas seleniipraecipitans]UUD64638.1 RES family NAD+ phosphorylase [Pseudomonas seleniipraecipitans]